MQQTALKTTRLGSTSLEITRLGWRKHNLELTEQDMDEIEGGTR